MSRFTRFSLGKIWFYEFGPCKRFDILQLCKHAMKQTRDFPIMIERMATRGIARYLHTHHHVWRNANHWLWRGRPTRELSQMVRIADAQLQLGMGLSKGEIIACCIFQDSFFLWRAIDSNGGTSIISSTCRGNVVLPSRQTFGTALSIMWFPHCRADFLWFYCIL